MSDNKTYNMINNIERGNLKIIISTAIDNQFKLLILEQKQILKEYLYKTCVLFGIYFYNKNFIDQLAMNDYRDIYSIMVLLLPYYELKESNTIESLDEILFNKDDKGKKILANFNIDHSYIKSSSIEEYFENAVLLISKSLKKTANKIMPNWLNIFPYLMGNYKESMIYNNFIDLYKNKQFNLVNDVILDVDNNKLYENRFELGYDTLYGTIYKFLYKDIVKIKWMIYDIYMEGVDPKVCPVIIIICNILKINDIVNNPWIKEKDKDNDNKKVRLEQQEKLKENWNKNVLTNSNNIKYLRSLILFYLRWENDETNLKGIKLSKQCSNFIRSNIEYIEEDNEDEFDKGIYSTNQDKINEFYL